MKCYVIKGNDTSQSNPIEVGNFVGGEPALGTCYRKDTPALTDMNLSAISFSTYYHTKVQLILACTPRLKIHQALYLQFSPKETQKLCNFNVGESHPIFKIVQYKKHYLFNCTFSYYIPRKKSISPMEKYSFLYNNPT